MVLITTVNNKEYKIYANIDEIKNAVMKHKYIISSNNEQNKVVIFTDHIVSILEV